MEFHDTRVQLWAIHVGHCVSGVWFRVLGFPFIVAFLGQAFVQHKRVGLGIHRPGCICSRLAIVAPRFSCKRSVKHYKGTVDVAASCVWLKAGFACTSGVFPSRALLTSGVPKSRISTCFQGARDGQEAEEVPEL